MSKERIAELKVTDLSKKGDGIALYTLQDGSSWPVEIPFTLPGDVITARLMRKRGGVYSGILLEIVSPSPERIKPRCIHFGSCGGCRWQNWPYEKQLQQKENFVRGLFSSLIFESTEFKPILACDPPWHYRNKMEFSFSQNAAKDRFLGLVMSKGRVFNLTECHLVNTWFADTVAAVRKWWDESGLEAYYPAKNTGSLRTLIVREGQRTGDRMVMITVSGNTDYALNKAQLNGFVECLRSSIQPSGDSKLSIFLRIQQAVKGSPTNFYEMLLHGPDHIRETLNIVDVANEPSYPLHFNVSPSAFFQPNSGQAEQLYSIAIQMTDIPQDAMVYDLYCGAGALALCAAKRAKQVVGIELSPEAALDARTNVKHNDLDNVLIITGDVGKVLVDREQKAENAKPEVVMVDPPRVGLDQTALSHVLKLKAKKILYISCNPITQAANIKEMIEAGYKILSVQPVDQFPHTAHIENIVVLYLD